MNVIGDRACDNDPLDEQLPQQGIEMISPHTSNRVRAPNQNGRWQRRHPRRLMAERLFALIQWQRRLPVRWEYYPAKLLGFAQLAALGIVQKGH